MTAAAPEVTGPPLPTGQGDLGDGFDQLDSLTAETFGYEVMGPIYGEFCLRLWALQSMIEDPQQTTLLFCARGGLRMQLAYERFLATTGLRPSVPVASLMVSRAVAMRGSLLRAVREDLTELLPAAATVVGYEFFGQTVRAAMAALAGIDPARIDAAWEIPCAPQNMISFLRHPDGLSAVTALADQEALFSRHLADALNGRSRGILVDTGFYGTTRELLAEGHPELDFGSILLVRSFRPGYPTQGARSVGLLLEAASYSPIRRSSALMRYWHFIEWLFEPELPSVRSFTQIDGQVRSNLEVADWPARVAPTPGTVFNGLMRYLDQLSGPSGARIVADGERAWSRLRRAIIWPDRRAAIALAVSSRTHDFGRDDAWTARPWRGPRAALRGSTMWREGEIARSGTPLRRPLLITIEAAYALRYLRNQARRFSR